MEKQEQLNSAQLEQVLVFSDFLISLAAGYSALPEAFAEVLGLYIEVSYGEPGKRRTIPFDLARSQGLFSKEVTALTFQAEKKTEEERRKFQTSYIIEEEQSRARWRMREKEYKLSDRQRAMEGKITAVPIVVAKSVEEGQVPGIT
jgi:hypothetical protein